MARKHPVEIPPPSPSSSEEEGDPSSEEEQEEEEDQVNNTNAGKDDEEDADETDEEEDSDENPSSEEEQEEEEEEEEEKVEDGMEEDKVNNGIACKDDEDDDDETEEEEEEGSDYDSESESDLLSPAPSAFKLKPVSPPLLPTSENGKAAVGEKVEAETLEIEAKGEVGGEKIEANGRVKRKIDVDAGKNMWEMYPLLDASLNEMESELRAGGALLLRQNFGLIGKSLMDELEREWKKLRQDEVKLFSRRNALIAKQAGLFLDRL